MNDLSAHFRASLWWLLPIAALAFILGLEVDWGAALRLRPPAAAPIVPKPVAAALLPDYTIEGGIAARSETVNRTLFNPTRRPAPQAVAEAAKPVMKKGQFTLTGTTVAGERSLAFLKEVAGGKARTVKQGDSINGLLVAEVKPDRVKLTQADDSEEIVLKVSTNPKVTPQPVAPPPQAGQQHPTPQPGQPLLPGAVPPPTQQAASPDVAQTLAERRRAARAAEAAAAAGGQAGILAQPPQTTGAQNLPAPGTPQAAGAAGATGQSDPGWAQIYQRYQQRRQQ